MKKFCIITGVLSIVFMGTSCVKNEIEQHDFSSYTTQNHVVPVELALHELDLVIGDLRGCTTRSLGINAAKVRVVSSESFTRSLSSPPVDTLLYVVDFGNDDGYAVLSADNRIPEPVIAVIDSGNSDLFINAESCGYDFSPEENMDDFNLYCPQYDDYYLAAAVNQKFVRTICTSYTETFVGTKWTGHTDEMDLPDGYFSNWKTSSRIEPMMETLWGQGPPFNSQCTQYDKTEYDNNKAPTGCVPVAIAQIMAYNEYPDTLILNKRTVDWTEMKTVENLSGSHGSEIGQADVASLMSDIGDYCGTIYTKEWAFTLPTDAKAYLAHRGYKNVKKLNSYDNNVIVDMLRKNLPVFVSAISDLANGHAWVIDGAIIQCSSETDTRRTFVHCNWGWDGSSNGYYASGVFDLTNGPVIIEKKYGDDDKKKPFDRNYNWHYRVITYDKPDK